MSTTTDEERARTGCLVFLMAIPIALALQAWVLYLCWGWFIVPLGVPEITAAHAGGIAATVSLVTSRSSGDSKNRTLVENATMLVLTPLFVLVFAWIFHSFM